jgi:superfamily II DNA helicase RecQ
MTDRKSAGPRQASRVELLSGQKAMSSKLQDRLRQTARAKLGYERLRPGQEEANTAVMRGCDTLGVMPTGSGKSAI